MPTKVYVAAEDAVDGVERVLAENTADDDAHELAVRVSASTGEKVTILPFRQEDGGYVPDEDAAETLQVATNEPEVEPETDAPALDALTVSELKTYAAEHEIDITGLKKKSELLDAIGKAQA